ncbi:MAG: efflux RND transporter periplasmic adaptor subunit [Acidobacteria bacterium]|nr:efflux RND transporter periplasmic adaptor subunit [Acidobacteriota bacterium]
MAISLRNKLAASAAVIAVVGVVAWRTTRPKPIAVVLGDVDRGRVERTVANTRAGTVNACRRAKLAPQAGGKIAALPVSEGERVREGQLLLELWSGDVAAEVSVAEERERGAVLRRDEACLRADVAERDAARAARLHHDGLVPLDSLDHASSSAKALRAACNAAGREILQSRAALEAARAGMTRTVVRAPFSGVVAKVTGELGELATPSPPGIPTPPAIDLIDDSCLYVTAPIDEVDVARVRLGQIAWITLEAMPDKRIEGRVRRIAPYVLDLEKQARTVDVDVELTRPEDAKALLVGYSADVEIILEAREGVVRIPAPAVLEGGRVYVYDAKRGTLDERRIETGISNWGFSEVRSGVEQGDKVVLSVERAGVKAGARVVPETPKSK